jgi:proline-rich protein PRCC
VPLSAPSLVEDEDDEEEAQRARERRALAAPPPPSGLSALLPKPVHDALGGGGRPGGGTKLQLGGDSSDDEADAFGAVALQSGSLTGLEGAGWADAAAAEEPGWAMHPSSLYAVQPGCSRTLAESTGWQPEPEAGATAAGGGDAQARLESALGGGEVRYLEVSQAELTAGREQLLARQTTLGAAALGAEYEAKLRAEAGAKPSDVAKRKHQIGSLLHDAKVQELKLLEGRAAGMQHRKMARQKYGW